MEAVQQALARRHLRYDRAGEEHFNLISALHKSLRDSDPHAGLYWLARMLAAGEDPLYVARRLVRFASEDVGNADPQALPLAVAAVPGLPPARHPRGRAGAGAVRRLPGDRAQEQRRLRGPAEGHGRGEESGSLPPPLVIRNAPTRLMKELGYGKGYRYAHDEPGGIADQQHLPDELAGKRFYEPTGSGQEAGIAERMKEWERLLEGRRPPQGLSGLARRAGARPAPAGFGLSRPGRGRIYPDWPVPSAPERCLTRSHHEPNLTRSCPAD